MDKKYEAQLHSLISRDELIKIRQSSLRILVHVEPPAENQNFGSLIRWDSYQVDVTQKTFELPWNGAVRYSSPMEIAGTYNVHDHTWLWPWHNPSTKNACENIKRTCDSMAEISALTSKTKFTVSPEEADLLAKWVTLRLGWQGVFPAHFPNQPTAFIAVEKLVPDHSLTYCVCCFGNNTDDLKLIAFAPGLAVCNLCADLQFEIKSLEASEKNLSPEQYAAYIAEEAEKSDAFDERSGVEPCIICARTKNTINSSHAALCVDCLFTVQNALKGS